MAFHRPRWTARHPRLRLPGAEHQARLSHCLLIPALQSPSVQRPASNMVSAQPPWQVTGCSAELHCVASSAPYRLPTRPTGVCSAMTSPARMDRVQEPVLLPQPLQVRCFTAILSTTLVPPPAPASSSIRRFSLTLVPMRSI